MNDVMEIGLVLFVLGTIMILVTHELEIRKLQKRVGE